jgi:hypothetical protein
MKVMAREQFQALVRPGLRRRVSEFHPVLESERPKPENGPDGTT